MPEGLSTGLRVRLIGQAVIAACLPWERVAVAPVEGCDLTMEVGGEERRGTSKVLLPARSTHISVFFSCSAFPPIASLPAASQACNDNYLVGCFPLFTYRPGTGKTLVKWTNLAGLISPGVCGLLRWIRQEHGHILLPFPLHLGKASFLISERRMAVFALFVSLCCESGY